MCGPRSSNKRGSTRLLLPYHTAEQVVCRRGNNKAQFRQKPADELLKWTYVGRSGQLAKHAIVDACRTSLQVSTVMDVMCTVYTHDFRILHGLVAVERGQHEHRQKYRKQHPCRQSSGCIHVLHQSSSRAWSCAMMALCGCKGTFLF